MSLSIWLTSRVTIETLEAATVYAQLCHNVSATHSATNESADVPISLQVKLLAIYLAHDLDPVTNAPMYEPHGATSQRDMREGQLSLAQAERRVWTHPECDPDGDGWMGDCDVSAKWKYRQQLEDWLEMSQVNPNPFNPVQHKVPPGDFRLLVLQVCLENIYNASTFAVRGGQMKQSRSWRQHGALPGSCFLMTRPLERPLSLQHGDDVVLSLWYNLGDTFRERPLGEAQQFSWSADEWWCFNSTETPRTEHCVRLPAIQPVARKREKVRETFPLSAMPLDALCLPLEEQQLAAHYQNADSDGNKKISEEEVGHLREGLLQDGWISHPEAVTFSKLDASGDQTISRGELWNWFSRSRPI
eukprot:CAMPEP_0119323218 /NCGR_PEP_ID=MMETSP1333-20130426/60317_1 /TAXON_ID=418940 /ORGANISM="Scyphosphaera apsteinii, Strain RCC1455" /LENGTH=358 /DNA_ID=CAMNT_0007330613 /DNA_START=244 /DNA_END=1320 /DNA_ORIENTATION=+